MRKPKKDFIVPAWGPDNEAKNKIYTLLYWTLSCHTHSFFQMQKNKLVNC